MNRHTLKITGTGPTGMTHEIAIDGTPIRTITMLNLHMDPIEIPVATMELIQPGGIDVETWARIVLDDATVGMLKSLGWTPPAEPALLDPDCRDGKHGSCMGGPCDCTCHEPQDSTSGGGE